MTRAQALAAEHPEVRLLLTEGRDRVGGNITTCSGDGYLWEEGPNSFQPSDAMLKAAVRTGSRAACLCPHMSPLSWTLRKRCVAIRHMHESLVWQARVCTL